MSNPFAPPVNDDGGRRSQKPSSDGPEATALGVLEYRPEHVRHHSAATPLYVFIAPVLVALFFAFIDATWSITGAALTAVALWYVARRRQKPQGARLKIVDSRLLVVDAAGTELLDIPLHELEDVTLDTKTVQRVQLGISTGGVPQHTYQDGRAGAGIDNSRIELVTSKDVIALTEYYTSNIDATDWFSKIRSFLRKNGWTPLDERERTD